MPCLLQPQLCQQGRVWSTQVQPATALNCQGVEALLSRVASKRRGVVFRRRGVVASCTLNKYSLIQHQEQQQQKPRCQGAVSHFQLGILIQTHDPMCSTLDKGDGSEDNSDACNHDGDVGDDNNHNDSDENSDSTPRRSCHPCSNVVAFGAHVILGPTSSPSQLL